MQTNVQRPARGQGRLLALVAAVAVVAGVAGAWAWGAYSEWRAAKAAEEAARLAEAERQSPVGQQRELVKSVLNDPDSAVFRNVRQSKTLPTAWCGEVNARNRMGGMVGFTRYIAILADSKVDGPDVRIEPPSDSSDQASRELFAGAWKTFC